eukprot:COSAG01_NODE_2976_length_6765_cov_22.300480_5_plen_143_part_00
MGYTALHYAADGGHAAVCTVLLQRGANRKAVVTGSGEKGKTAAALAEQEGHPAVAQLLREAPAAAPAVKKAAPKMKASIHPAGARGGGLGRDASLSRVNARAVGFVDPSEAKIGVRPRKRKCVAHPALCLPVYRRNRSHRRA